MWIIWKEEFRKIASRKILWIAFCLLLGFAAFRLFTELGHYTVTIDGKNFRGKEAVEMDKALTKQYAGVLTEEKIDEIYYKYGFYPYGDPENTQIEKNFLSQCIWKRGRNLIMFSDGAILRRCMCSFFCLCMLY